MKVRNHLLFIIYSSNVFLFKITRSFKNRRMRLFMLWK